MYGCDRDLVELVVSDRPVRLNNLVSGKVDFNLRELSRHMEMDVIILSQSIQKKGKIGQDNLLGTEGSECDALTLYQ